MTFRPEWGADDFRLLEARREKNRRHSDSGREEDGPAAPNRRKNREYGVGIFLALGVGMYPSSSSKKLFALGAATLVAVALLPATPAAAADDPCSTTDVSYAVNGSLMIKDTQFGAADGVYPLGAGKAKVRFEKNGTARLMGYELDNSFTVKASFAVWSTTVVTQSRTTVASSCDGASSGVMDHGNVVWQTPAVGYRSDGTIDCAGNVCGKFGAPAPGSTPLHETASVKFQPFHFNPDGKTFSMPYTQVSHSDSPKQTAYLALSGRETGRSCVTAPAACQ